MKANYTAEQTEAAAKSLGFQNAELMIAHFKSKVMDGGLYEALKQAGTTSQQIKVRDCSIVCVDHPEWGTWGVMEDRGGYFEIHGRRRRTERGGH